MFGITIGFRNDALQWVLTIAAGLVAVVLGLLFAVRPTAAVVPWSNAAGIAWLILLALLTAAQAHELVAWSTDVVLAALGLAAALVAYRAATATWKQALDSLWWCRGAEIQQSGWYRDPATDHAG